MMVELTMQNMAQLLADPEYRIAHLYKIVDKHGKVQTFVPNDAQRALFEDLWYRNIIPKARQRGISTAVQIAMLDSALFNTNFSGGVVAQDRDTASVIFSKVKFAYDNLPDALRAQLALTKQTAEEMHFANGSKLKVATSVRGWTLQWLHVSEFGKICAKYPDKAKEIITGSLPAVDRDGVVFIESTAEGREGAFYEMVMAAKALAEAGNPLQQQQYRIHFFSWWDAAEYEAPPEGVILEPKDIEYFDSVEAKIGRPLSDRKRAWYVLKRRTDFHDDDALMKQEYPSTVDECFEVSTEGTYYPKQFTILRKERRICRVPYQEGVPVNTFWDIGNSDGTGVWYMQIVGLEHRYLAYDEDWGETYAHTVAKMQARAAPRDWVWGKHYLPHDAAHARKGAEANKTPEQMLNDLGLRNTVIVPRIALLNTGIQQTRDYLPTCWFDEEGCHAGLRHLELYKKRWNSTAGAWADEPNKLEGHSEAADAIRQAAQAKAAGLLVSSSAGPPGAWRRKPGNWRTV